MFCMDDQEKPKAIIKRPIKGSASYVKTNFKLVDGKMVYDRSFKSFEQEENEKIMGAYQKRNGKPLKEDATKIREENERRREESIKRRKEDARKTKIIVDKLQEKETLTKKTVISKTNNTNTQVKNVNLFAELKIGEDDKSILLDVIKYSLSAREITILKDFYGSKYDGLNRKTNSKETKSNARIVISKIKPKLKETLKIKNDKLKYRYYLLSFKNEVEYISQNIFKDIPKSTLENAYKKLTVEEEGIAKKYFDSLKGEKLTDEELIVFSNVIFPKLNVYVFSPKGIDAYFKVYTTDEQKVLRDIVKFLPKSYLEIIKKKFGENLNGQNTEKLSKSEVWNFNKTITPKIEKKCKELSEQKGTCDYYISLIKGFSSLNIEAKCHVKDEIDKKILLSLLEKLNERDLNILFTTEELSNITRNELSSKRYRITNYLKKSIIELRKVYDDQESYKILLEQLLNGNPINEAREKQTVNKQADKIDFTISFAHYLEKVSLNILADVINYALKDDEKEFIYTLFAGDYEKSVVTKLKNKVKRFNKINIKINSFVNYIVDFLEEYEEFLDRLKAFPKDEDYNLYQIKDLKTFLDIPYDANLKFILKNSLDKEEKLLLQKRFGLAYEGFLARKIDSKEKYSLMLIKDKIIKQYSLIKDNNLSDIEKLKFLKEEESIRKKGPSLIEYLNMKEDEKENLDLALVTLIPKYIDILKKKFGPLYDGINREKLNSNENNCFFELIMPKLREAFRIINESEEVEKELNKLTSKNKFGYRYLSLYEFFELQEDEKDTLLTIVNDTFTTDEISLLQKRFGPLYDGVNIEEITDEEKKYIRISLLPRLKDALNSQDLPLCKKNKVSLQEYLGLDDEEIKYLSLAITTLKEEHILLLQKNFGSLYVGVNTKELTRNEKSQLAQTIKPKLKEVIRLLNEVREEQLEEELDKLTSKNKFGYRNLSLYELLGLSLSDKNVLINSINKIFDNNEISLLQKRFGPLYDGVGIKGVTEEENKIIIQVLIPKLKWKIDKKLGKEKKVSKNYRIKSLFTYLNIHEEQKYILLDVINIFSLEDKKMLQKRFGSSYDGADVEEITKKEKSRLTSTIIPKVKKMFEILSSVSKEEYKETLRNLAKTYQKKSYNNTLTRKMTIEEYEHEQRRNLTKVVAIEEVEIKEGKKESYENENIAYLKDLVKILEEEKKKIFKNYKKELCTNKYNLSLFNSKLKIYALNLVSYGFTKEEAMFILLLTTEELNISKAKLLSLLGIEEEILSEIYLNSINKIKNLLSNELDNYLSLLKGKRDSYE